MSRDSGIAFTITPFLTERIEEVLTGARGEVVLNLFASDLGVLDRKAEEIRQILASVPGAADVFSQTQSGMPEMTVTLRQGRLKQFGFQPLNVLEAVQTAYQGATVAQTYDSKRVFDVSVILDPANRQNSESGGALLVRNPTGLRLPLRELANVSATSGRFLVEHEGTLRRWQVTCNVEGRDVVSFVTESSAARPVLLGVSVGYFAT
jgi:Cu/Ag efflux pump CusA